MKWELENFHKSIDNGIPSDDRQVDAWVSKLAKHNSNLIQWLEDFKAKYGEYEDAQKHIKDAEEVLKKYKEKVGPMLARVAIDKAADARAKDGSPLVITFFIFSFFLLPTISL